MQLLLWLVRVSLAAVFFVAGASKLIDRSNAKQSLEGFGIRRSIVGAIAICLPLAEITVAGLLAVPATTRWGAVVAVLMLLIFAGLIAANLAEGRRPDCRCFGQVNARPIGWHTFARNLVLACGAGLLALLGEAAALPEIPWLSEVPLSVPLAILMVALVGQGWFSLQLFKQNGCLLLRMDGLERALFEARLGIQPELRMSTALGLGIGTVAPSFSLSAIDGQIWTLRRLLERDRPLLLVFVDPGCGPCAGLMPLIGEWQSANRQTVEIAVVSRGSERDNREKFQVACDVRVLLQEEREVADAYEVHGTPGAVLVLQDGTVGSEVGYGAEGCTQILIRAAGIRSTETQAA